MIGKRNATSIVSIGIIGLLLTLSGCGQNAEAGTDESGEETQAVTDVHAVTGGGPAPFVLKSEDGNLSGQNYELAEAIFDKLPQYKLIWDIVDWSALFGNLDSGRDQIAVNNFNKTPEREEKYVFSDPLYEDIPIAIVREDSELQDGANFEDLVGQTAIAATSINSTTALERWNEEHPDEQIPIQYSGSADTYQTSWQQIQSGVVDFELGTQTVYNYNKQQTDVSQYGIKIVKLGEDASQEVGGLNAYFLFPKGQEQLASDVHTAFKEVIDDGTAKTISEKWFGQDLTVDIE